MEQFQLGMQPGAQPGSSWEPHRAQHRAGHSSWLRKAGVSSYQSSIFLNCGKLQPRGIEILISLFELGEASHFAIIPSEYLLVLMAGLPKLQHLQ